MSKTAEEILIEIGGIEIPFDENVTMYFSTIISAMEEYSTQQNTLLKNEIRELKNTNQVKYDGLLTIIRNQKAENEELITKKEKIIEGLKKLSNEYFVSEGHYVISKYNLENFIEFFTT